MDLRNWRSPRYAVDRLAWEIDQRRHADEPWMNRHARFVLDQLLRPTDVGIEWGSGRSTTWFASRVGSLTSVESDPTWFRSVTDKLRATGVADKVQYLQIDAEEFGDDPHGYVSAVDRLGPIDLAIVDGQLRAQCAVAAATVLRPGGVLVLDNANWYVPSTTRSPDRLQHRDKDRSTWETFDAAVADWRRVWTSNGVVDTAIWIRR